MDNCLFSIVNIIIIIANVIITNIVIIIANIIITNIVIIIANITIINIIVTVIVITWEVALEVGWMLLKSRTEEALILTMSQ